MDNRVYWIWLQQGFGEGSAKPFQLHSRVPGGVKAFYEGGPALWNTMEMISDKEARSLHSFSLSEAEALLQYCLTIGWQVITPECEKYPEALRNIFDPPAVLYVKGTLPDLDAVPVISIVGARKPCPQSEDMAKGIGYQLASGGAVVVSGGALGIDRAGLMGALSAMGPVISVQPVSLNSSYVVENAPLRQAIVERGGALVSEYALQSGVQSGTFQIRNRIISGLSCGVVIIEAKQKSGTMITAKRAREQNRDVFVVPPPPGAVNYQGSLGLIEDGAKAVRTGEEVLEEYVLRFSEKKAPQILNLFDELSAQDRGISTVADSGRLFQGAQESAAAQPQEEGKPRQVQPATENPHSIFAEETASCSPGAQILWELLRQGSYTAIELQELTGLSPGEISSTLLDFEMECQVVVMPGKRYRLKNMEGI